MRDILQEAEDLIEKHATSGYIHRDATLLLPMLVSEIKCLQAQGQAKDFGLSGLSNEVYRLREQLAKWQQIAIDERAQIIQYHRGILHPLDRPSNFWESMPKDEYAECRDLAAKELGLQVDDTGEELTIAYMLGSKDANDRLKVLQKYVRRLEKEFIDLKIADVWDDTYLPGRNAIRHRERAQEVAHATLEKIRRG